MTDKSYPDYLRILEESVNERRALKNRAADEYRQIKETFSSAENELDIVKAEYEPLGSVLEPLQDQRSELKQIIRDRNNQKIRLEKELERIGEELARTNRELERFEKEVEPMRKEITSLLRQTKPVRNRIDELELKVYQLQKQRDQARQRLEEAQNAFSEANNQYLLGLQWEKRKPLIMVTGLVLLFVVILVAFVWAAKQLPIYGLLTVIIVTFLMFFTIVITLLRQDEKLREENFVQLARDILKYLRLARQ